jgi:hypothetical protein
MPTVKRRKHWLSPSKNEQLALKVLSARAVGGSVSSIAADLKVSEMKVRQSIDLISKETKEGLLSDFLANRLPLNVAESLELNRIIIGKAMAIASSSSDYRVQIEGLRLASQVSSESAKIIADADTIARAIQRSVLVVHSLSNASKDCAS